MERTTIKDATYQWVSSMNAIPQGMISELMKHNIDSWHEATTPSFGDTVYIYNSSQNGRIIEIKSTEDRTVYVVELYNEEVIECEQSDFEVERYYNLPMWGTMWSFGDSADDYWLEELGGIQLMSDCGFRIYEHEEFGYFFGIDGCGYDFYEAHWIPLYKARGLRWHDVEDEENA